MPAWAADAVLDLSLQSPPPFDLRHPGSVSAWAHNVSLHLDTMAAQAHAMGLDNLFANGRILRDVRVADFNGDGLPDLVSNTYTCNGDTRSKALLFVNNGDGTFTEDPSFSALPELRGFGETIVVADFDNDGAPDIFLPYYVHPDGFKCAAFGGGTYATPPSAPSFLPTSRLIHNNGPFSVGDGRQHFTDVTTAAGLSLMPDYSASYAAGAGAALFPPEGAQAADVNGDGWPDLYAGSHLFINNGDGTFTDRAAQYGLPILEDEGAHFIDWNNDGRLDLVLLEAETPSAGLRLFEGTAGGFIERTRSRSDRPVFSTGAPTYAPLPYCYNYGLTVADMDQDGREDIVLAGSYVGSALCGAGQPVAILRNSGDGFERVQSPGLAGVLGPIFTAPADLDGDAMPDLVLEAASNGAYAAFAAHGVGQPVAPSMSIEVRGSMGEMNQYGRTVHVTPTGQSGTVFTRVVDGGSGYMAQGDYGLNVASPYAGEHEVSVVFPPLVRGGASRRVAFAMQTGQRATLYQPSVAFPSGRAEVQGVAVPVTATDVVQDAAGGSGNASIAPGSGNAPTGGTVQGASVSAAGGGGCVQGGGGPVDISLAALLGLATVSQLGRRRRARGQVTVCNTPRKRACCRG